MAKESAKERFNKARERALRGVMTLEKPLMSQNVEVTEVRYDFSLLSGYEVVECLDSDPGFTSVQGISARQAMNLFSRAAEKCRKDNREMDAQDYLQRMGEADTIAAVRVARLFFMVMSREGDLRIRPMP